MLTAYQLSGPVPIKRPVTLPADFPIVEKRAPIGLAVLTVLLVVGAGYAVWHYLPREQAVVAEKVPPVPDRLLASRPAPASPTDAATAAPATTAPATTTAATPAPPAQEVRSAPATLPAEAWPARRDSVAPPTAAANQAAPLAPPVVVAVPAPPPPPRRDVRRRRLRSFGTAIGQAQAAQPPAPVEQPRVTAPPAPAPSRKPWRAAPPADAAAANLPVKVDTPVRVWRNSWIELRAPAGDVLAQTYVRAGESYTVPAGIAYRVIDAR